MKRLIFSAALALAGLLLPALANTPAASGMPSDGEIRLVNSRTSLGIQLHCPFGTACGHVYNDDNLYSLLISDNLGAWNTPQWPLTWHSLAPGQNSVGIGVVDADALYVPAGCTATVGFIARYSGPQWYKVSGGQQIHVTDLTGTC